MRQVPFSDQSLAGACALYSIIHLALDERPAAFAEIHRVLRAGAPALIGFHVSEDTHHLDEWWGIPVSIDFRFLRPDVIAAELRTASFEVEE